ncbi:MAG: efflux RND transporter permease subunit, partial [Alphaproteobacteria bacterium]|nr:efflux RND transporter permease subunit [Alphaproteobacteria bacterium]
MNLPAFFIRRPVATILLTIGLAIAGLAAFPLLPVAPLPDVDIPTIFVQAQMPGASPETMATSVATPLERHLGTIADVTEMTSRSSQGSTFIVLQFGLSRDINGAARDVQAAINAARADLPSGLRSNPTYRKLNPAAFPVLILSLTSKTLTPGQIYNSASNIIQQKLSQISGIGQVELGGSSLPAVRIDLNPLKLFKYGIGLEDVRAAIAGANANAPKGAVVQGADKYEIYTNDRASQADQFRNLIIAYRNNAPVRLSDVAHVYNGVEDIRNLGMTNNEPAVLVILFRQPGANIIKTVDAVKKELPGLKAALPPSVTFHIVSDRTTTIRTSLIDVESAMGISVVLVILVVFFFLRNGRAAIIPTVAVPLSLIGTFAVMYAFGFTLDNLSLMALTVATGFVVDDAIVVLENVARHIEDGMPRFEAALKGAGEVSFTVLSMSLSLIAVFLPVVLMGGLPGRFFHEFGITLSASIVISLVVSLTTTPMLCAWLDMAPGHGASEGRLGRIAEGIYVVAHRAYERSLGWALRYPGTIMIVLAVTIVLNFYLFVVIPKSFMPSEDTGMIEGGIVADQDISFQLMSKKFKTFMKLISEDPAVANVTGFTGGSGPRGGGTNSGHVFIQLKPLSERHGLSTNAVAQRLRGKLMQVAGARIYLVGASDVRAGGRQGNGAYQYTLEADRLSTLNTWVPRITDALKKVPQLQDVNSDHQAGGLQVNVDVDRTTASRLGVSLSQIDNTLYDAFGQRPVSTIYQNDNTYHVVMAVEPRFWQSPSMLRNIYVSTSGGAISGSASTAAAAGTVVLPGSTSTAASVASDAVRNARLNAISTSAQGGISTGAALSTSVERVVPLAALSHLSYSTAPLSVSHQGPFVATTFSFNLPPHVSLGEATAAINRTMARLHVPISVHGEFAGTAAVFRTSLGDEPLLILSAILAVYL